MIISKIYGGLGNQLFQYALGRYLSVINNTELKLDVSLLNETPEHITYRKFELDKFKINGSIATNNEIEKLRRTHLKGIHKSLYWRWQYSKPYYKQNYIKEKDFIFDENIMRCGDNVYLDGYWQSPFYFDKIRNELLQELIPTQALSFSENEYLKKIISTHSVSMHIRRGDYITNPKNKEIYLEIDVEYFDKAISYVNNNIDNVFYFIFSDDLAWAKENIHLENCFFIDVEEPVICLYLMSLCKHNITTNSTFSWWGAWLNANKDKLVITPKEWFVEGCGLTTNYLVPDKWLIF